MKEKHTCVILCLSSREEKSPIIVEVNNKTNFNLKTLQWSIYLTMEIYFIKNLTMCLQTANVSLSKALHFILPFFGLILNELNWSTIFWASQGLSSSRQANMGLIILTRSLKRGAVAQTWSIWKIKKKLS